MANAGSSWSNNENIENLIAKKRVDLSLFKYGIHIPQEYHERFLSIIPGNFIKKGTSKKIRLIFDDKIAEVELRNINSLERTGDTLQIRYDGNKDLINFLKNKFKTSYEYIINQQQSSNGKVIIPDSIGEYIEFYKMEQQLYAYKIKLITHENTGNIKDDFFNYIGEKGKLNTSFYQKSYKLILLLALINNLDAEGKALHSTVCKEIQEFYIDRHTKGLLAEQHDSKIQSQISALSVDAVKSVISENAYKVISDRGYIFKEERNENEFLLLNQELWKQLSKKDLEWLREILKSKLDIYYETRVGVVNESNNNTLQKYFIEIMSTYLQARNNQPFAGHSLGEAFRRGIPEYFNKLSFIDKDQYTITGSIGQGNWAKIPWIALMNKASTTSTQNGVYVIYLFSQDMKKLYLTLNQGVTDLKNQFGTTEAKQKLVENAQKIRDVVHMERDLATRSINLEGGNLGIMYEKGNIGAIEYDVNSIPNDKKLLEDLEKMVSYYEKYLANDNGGKESVKLTEYQLKEYIEFIHKYITSKGYTFSLDVIKNFYLALKSKPFVLLAGISGTGKSKLVELFAEAIGATSENGRYNIIPVRPDWSDPSDLLGYRNIEGNFQPGPLTTIIKRALDNPTLPHLLCLDEMNLARVEYYFSDILSIIETRRFRNGIVTDKLFKSEAFGNDDISREQYDQLYIPDNLYIVGTVNMDETTFPFSKKVLDRANTIEFNKVNLSLDFESFSKDFDVIEPVNILNTGMRSKYIKLVDCIKERDHIEEVIYILEKINNILEKVGLQFGYRIRDEITFYSLYAVNEELMDFDKALDYAIKQKILPRIQGSNLSIKEVLIQLFTFFINDTSKRYDPLDNDIWGEMTKYVKENNVKYPLCAEKACKMIRRYDVDGFTTFWE